MEKIQKALAKARSDRAAAPATPATSTTPAKPAAAAQGGTQGGAAPKTQTRIAWDLLSPFNPDPHELQRARIVTIDGSRESVPFDVMRTKTLQTMRANNWRRLAITSPSPACGKSTIALNLAFSMSRQPESHTILMELDLRRPSLGKSLSLSPPSGVAGILKGETDFRDQAQCYNGNLALSLSLGTAPNPAELLQGGHVGEALSAIEAEYAPDLMIFDMPPMLVSDDMMAFAGHVDCVLLVAAAESTTIKEIDACERELASQSNVMGVAMNKCRYMGAEHGYSYYG